MTTIADILGTDINISYEDGLRLSELVGLREQTLYQLDHIWASSAVYIVMLMLLVMVFGVGCYVLVDSAMDVGSRRRDRESRTRYEGDPDFDEIPKSTFLYHVEDRVGTDTRFVHNPLGVPKETYVRETRTAVYIPRKGMVWGIVFAIVFMLGLTVCFAATAYMEYSLNADLVNLDGQIDAILGKYV